MSNLCWLGLGLFCLVIGAVVVVLALLAWLVAWLLKPRRPTAPVEPVVDVEVATASRPYSVEARPAAEPAPEAPAGLPAPQDIVQEVILPAAGAVEPAEEPAREIVPEAETPAPAAPLFTVYWNRANRYAKVHRATCPYIAQHGGTHKDDQGGYEHFATYEAARRWAEQTGLVASDCKGCRPGERE